MKNIGKWILIGLIGSCLVGFGIFSGYQYKTAITPPAAIVETVVKEEPPTPPVVVVKEVIDNNIIQVSKDWMIIEAGLYKLTKGHLNSPYVKYQSLVGEFENEKIVFFTEKTIISSSNEAVLTKLDKLPSFPPPVVVIPNIEKTKGWVIDDNVVEIPKGVYEVHGTLLTPAGKSISSGSQVVQFLFRTTAARAEKGKFVFLRKVEDENVNPSLTIGTEEKVEVAEPEKETIVAQADKPPTPVPTPTPAPAPTPKTDPKPAPTPTPAPKPTPNPTPTQPSTTNASYFEPDQYTYHLQLKNPESNIDEIPHPHGYYKQTEVPNTIKFVIHVPIGWIGIIGGYRVDGVDRGVYQAVGPGVHTRVVTDGFVLLIRTDKAKSEFEFRLNQARQNGWACENINWGPIPN